LKESSIKSHYQSKCIYWIIW